MTAPLVSICINNYNYGRYVAEAIESALAQREVTVEVVVVDDGSTDDSVAVIRRYVPRVRLVEQANGGHAAALNAGFRASQGELVIFLDADDFLEPDCAARAAAAMSDGITKVHWRLRLVDADRNAFGFNPSSRTPLAVGSVVDDIVRSGWYSTVPTSGNCFRRSALEPLMPIPVEDFRHGAEAYLLLGTGLQGPVAAIGDPLSNYRVHGGNDFAARDTIETAALRRRLEHARILDRWIPKLAAPHGHDIPPGIMSRHPEFVLMHLLVARLLEHRRPSASEALGLSVAAARNRALRRRRRILLGALGPLLPLLPRAAVEQVRDVAFAGKPMRAIGR